MDATEIKYIKEYETADYLLKHKDAVKLCIRFLDQMANIKLTRKQLEEICGEYAEYCYIGSNKWRK